MRKMNQVGVLLLHCVWDNYLKWGRNFNSQGINTVELDREFFTAHVEQGQTVQAGELIAEFDIEQIKAKGYPIYTPVLVTNSADFASIQPMNDGKIVHGDKLLKLSKD